VCGAPQHDRSLHRKTPQFIPARPTALPALEQESRTNWEQTTKEQA
jgi:hypothetical protein